MGTIASFIEPERKRRVYERGPGAGSFTAFQTLTFGMKYFQKVATTLILSR